MSKGTDQLDAAMGKHSANKDACQAANSAKSAADKAFADSDQDLQAAIAAVAAEAAQLAKEATGTIPVQPASAENVLAMPDPTPAQ